MNLLSGTDGSDVGILEVPGTEDALLELWSGIVFGVLPKPIGDELHPSAIARPPLLRGWQREGLSSKLCKAFVTTTPRAFPVMIHVNELIHFTVR